MYRVYELRETTCIENLFITKHELRGENRLKNHETCLSRILQSDEKEREDA